MPEGHSIHRYARVHRALLAGQRVSARSPQGRFADGARAIDGATLVDVEAQGKHLFYRFATNGSAATDVTVHVHLGLFGHFRHFAAPGSVDHVAGRLQAGNLRADPAQPTAGTRLVLAAQATQVHLAGATTVELLDPAAEAALRARLGPDPLHGDDPEPAWAALRRRSAPIGRVLLDQRVIAGIGNVYRAEILFIGGIHPERPAREIDRAAFDALWKTLRRLMVAGERSGRIVTIQPEDRTRPPSRLRDDERLYVYQRTDLPCLRCGTSIRAWPLGARTVYACPHCQAT